jgi:hypothetical protein
MARFFPTQTLTWKIEEPAAFRRVSMSLVEMAVLTGVVLRVYRALARSYDAGGSFYLVMTFTAGFLLLFGMATLHLGNFPVRHWTWRAPLFAAVEAATEAVVSLLLIALHREPLGSTQAEFGDWPAITAGIFGWRVTTIVLYVLLLAGVVQISRYFLIRREHRGHTFEAVHHTAERESAGDT